MFEYSQIRHLVVRMDTNFYMQNSKDLRTGETLFLGIWMMILSRFRPLNIFERCTNYLTIPMHIHIYVLRYYAEKSYKYHFVKKLFLLWNCCPISGFYCRTI